MKELEEIHSKIVTDLEIKQNKNLDDITSSNFPGNLVKQVGQAHDPQRALIVEWSRIWSPLTNSCRLIQRIQKQPLTVRSVHTQTASS